MRSRLGGGEGGIFPILNFGIEFGDNDGLERNGRSAVWPTLISRNREKDLKGLAPRIKLIKYGSYVSFLNGLI